MNQPKHIEFKVGTKTYRIETGELALQASGSVKISLGDTVVLVAATSSRDPREGIDFFPLMVDYEEKAYSFGKIPGSYHRREAKPPESAVLTSRLIDRPIRPLFPDGYRNDVQVVATLVSSDQSTQADIVAVNGASAALALSDIPFFGPIGAVRVGRINNKWVLDPTYEELQESSLDLVVAGTDDAILMVEAAVNMLNEEMLLSAIEFGHEEIKKIVASINQLVKEAGKPKQQQDVDYKLYLPAPELKNYIEEHFYSKFSDAMHVQDKAQRVIALSNAKKELKENLNSLSDDNAVKALYLSNTKFLAMVVDSIEEKVMKHMVLEEKIRIDGRTNEQIREISSKVGLLPRTHGSGLFTRGQTQVLSVATLGSAGDMQSLDEVNPETEVRYLHHYNFPGYSVGEPKPLRTPGRREVGHGNLARRALLPVLPDEKEFPYTIRVVSEVLSSNGSSSMASTCGSTLALMDAGVPLKKMVGGVAMGLVMGEGKYAILTDILGDEDHLGDMDFKVTGSLTGITALQMDIKIRGISIDVMRDALEQARKGRLHIIGKMMETITEPKSDLSPYAPRIITISITPEKIGELIGPGGKTIKKIVEETGVKIDVDDTGTVFIISSDREAAEKAKAWVTRLTRVPKIGEVYDGTVARITNFGAFIELYPGLDGLIHISNISDKRVRSVEEVVKLGDPLKVKIAEIDNQGRVNLVRANSAWRRRRPRRSPDDRPGPDRPATPNRHNLNQKY
jgi:polyribonucleotide nucleotidyltransferase